MNFLSRSVRSPKSDSRTTAVIHGFILGSAATAGVVLFAAAILTHGLPFTAGLAAVIGIPFLLIGIGVPS
jgi:hypothetical protein